MKRHIPLLAVATLALAFLMILAILARVGLSLSQKLSFVLIFIFTLTGDVCERVYYGIISHVDSIVDRRIKS